LLTKPAKENFMTPSTSTRSNSQVPTFESIGVKPVINCQGTFTIISGSRALEQVAQAMLKATDNYVHMDELMEKAGQRLAELTGAEWGYISSGCAAALTEVTAACMAGADPEKMARLPQTAGMRNEVIVQKAHRNTYDRACRLAGAEMIEVVTLADARAALCDRTAMILIVGDLECPDDIPPAELIRLGHERGVPTLVDAAAQRPDIPNRYLQMGADAVAYSGGKCLRGPQASGLVLGRKDLLQAAFLNSAPHHGPCRSMKAGKEEVMGLLAAVEAWVRGRDHQAEWRMWKSYIESIRQAVVGLPSVRTEVRQPGIANVTPSLFITWDPEVLQCTYARVHKELFEGDPRITLHLLSDGLLIIPYMMEAGDDRIVAARLHDLLAGKLGMEPGTAHDLLVAQVGGMWQIDIEYTLGHSTHSVTLLQDGKQLSGTYRSQFAYSDVTGHVEGANAEFATRIGYEANIVHYVFTGASEGDVMRGTVSLGEYGSARWTAHRTA
jgi:L-seryl-tRNA(Ser) seleniumtransferase